MDISQTSEQQLAARLARPVNHLRGQLVRGRDSTEEELKRQCEAIARRLLGDGFSPDDFEDTNEYHNYDEAEIAAMDDDEKIRLAKRAYCAEEWLDVEFIVSMRREYLGARLCAAFGGPNIWVNTRDNSIRGYWGFKSYETDFIDNIGLDDYFEELSLSII